MKLIRWILHIPDEFEISIIKSYIPTYKQKDPRSESGTSRESNILCFWLCSLFCRVCHREDISDRPPEICIVRSPVDECCNRARKMNPYEAKRNCSREKFRVEPLPPSRGNAVRHFTQSANSVKQAHRAFKGDLIGTKRPSEEILVVDTTVVSHPTFLFFTLPLEVCFHLVSIPCNCARTMNATPWTTLVLLSSNFLGSENRLLSDGEEEGRKDEGIEENSCGNYCEFTFIICKKFLLFNNVYEFEKI